MRLARAIDLGRSKEGKRTAYDGFCVALGFVFAFSFDVASWLGLGLLELVRCANTQ